MSFKYVRFFSIMAISNDDTVSVSLQQLTDISLMNDEDLGYFLRVDCSVEESSD